MQKKLINFGLIAAVLTSVTLAVPVLAATSTVIPTSMQDWTFIRETPTPAGVGSGSLVSGPSNPPEGEGSARLTVNNSSEGQVLAKNGYSSVKLDDLENLKYSTYRTSGADDLAITLQFDFDNDVSDTDDAFKGRIVYEPYHTQDVETAQWQEWDALDDTAGNGNGNWWLTRSATVFNNFCPQSNPCTLAEVLTTYPNAGIRKTTNPNVWLKAGSGWNGGFDGNVDALQINDDIYDFEPTIKLTNKDECKENGWERSNDPVYKNQGDCVSVIASEGKAKGNPIKSIVNFLKNIF